MLQNHIYTATRCSYAGLVLKESRTAHVPSAAVGCRAWLTACRATSPRSGGSIARAATPRRGRSGSHCGPLPRSTRGLGLPTRKVARLLEKIAAIPEVLDMNFSRWDFRASIDEAFLKVQETRRLPTHDGGEAVWEFANLGKVFKYLIAERPVLKALFQDLQRRCPSTPENPWSLVRGEVYSPKQ